MEGKKGKGRQKIEMKLIESKDARFVTFSKRKLSLFRKASELSTLSGADVGILLLSPTGKPYSYGSTGIEKIIDKFLEWKLNDSQVVGQTDGEKSNVFQAFDDLCKELQIRNEEEKSQKMRYPDLEIPSDKYRLEQLVAFKLRLDKIKKEAKINVLADKFKFDLNVVPESNEGGSSETH